MIYGTTDMFLKAFGFKTIKELPSIEEFIGADVFINGDSNESA